MGTMPGATAGDRLVITLEDAAARSRWASLRGRLSPTPQWHFVAVVDGQARYDSPPFAAPYTLGMVPMAGTGYRGEDWVPAMDTALHTLCARITADGWTEVGQGRAPWEHVYRRAG
ncbi:MAG: hypothetical protein ACOYBY_09750 [Dermatophilaceae bacterium]